MNSTVKQVVFWLVIVLSGVLLWQVVKAGNNGVKEREINFSQFMNDVDQAKVKDVTAYRARCSWPIRQREGLFPYHRPRELS